MPDLTVRLIQKDDKDHDQIVAEGSHDNIKILRRGLLKTNQCARYVCKMILLY